MNGKNLKTTGIVSIVIGAIITIFGTYKYKAARSMLQALDGAASLFGADEGTYRSGATWLSEAGNYKLMIIVGAIILIVGIILTVSAAINANTQTEGNEKVSMSNSTNDKVVELKNMLDNGLITPEEYEMKKKELLEKM